MAANLRIRKVFQWWVVENHYAQCVVYCPNFNEAITEIEVQLLERMLASVKENNELN